MHLADASNLHPFYAFYQYVYSLGQMLHDPIEESVHVHPLCFIVHFLSSSLVLTVLPEFTLHGFLLNLAAWGESQRTRFQQSDDEKKEEIRCDRNSKGNRKWRTGKNFGSSKQIIISSHSSVLHIAGVITMFPVLIRSNLRLDLEK